MACFGSKAIRNKTHKGADIGSRDMDNMDEVDKISKPGGRKHVKYRRTKEESRNAKKNGSRKNTSKRLPKNDDKMCKDLKRDNSALQQAAALRRKPDPETVKYFSEIANLFESGGLELEERYVICGNALEETRGKEFALATDRVISRTIQTLLEGCDVHQLRGFLNSCAKDFPLIAIDKSGSHVAETALKSLAVHLQDKETHTIIEATLTKICQVIAVKPVDVMCSSYGSHVIRSLLCLCRGIPIDSLAEYHSTKTSVILAERLKITLPRSGGNHLEHLEQGFPSLLKFLVEEILRNAKEDLPALRINRCSSFILQVALKLLVGDNEGLSHVIYILLGCDQDKLLDGKFIEVTEIQEIRDLLKDTAYSHLMEVILEVSPEAIYNEILAKIFKGSLFQISSHHCGSFVVQALVASAKYQTQVELICEELVPKIKELLELGKSGVVASLLAACQRLKTNEQKISQSLAAAVRCRSDSCIVSRILFLDCYIACEDKSNWKWSNEGKMHTLGCLMLQTIFRCPSDMIQPFIASITSLEPDRVFEIAKDVGGGRLVESFLSSDASPKQKHKIILKLEGHFAELSMLPSGSFTVEKCFTVGNVSHKEMIVSELMTVQAELSKTKHGPYLLKRLDVDGFARRPDQWKSRQTSKQTVYKEFLSTFGSENSKERGKRLVASSHPPSEKSVKQIRKEINQSLDISMSNLGLLSVKRRKERVGDLTVTENKRNKVAGNTDVGFISKMGKRKKFHLGDNAAPTDGGGKKRFKKSQLFLS